MIKIWAGGVLEQCPLSLPDEIWEAVGWWEDWENKKTLPFGGQDRMMQPRYVDEAIDLCNHVRAAALTEKAKVKSK